MELVRLSETIAAAPERVFALATDIEGAPTVLPQIKKVEMLSPPGPTRVGTRWRETRKGATVVLEVTGYEPGRSFVVGCRVMGADYRTRFTFRPEGGGTRVDLDTSAEPSGALSGLMVRMTKGMMAKGMAKDLAALKAAAERGA